MGSLSPTVLSLLSLALSYGIYHLLLYPFFVSSLSKVPAAHWTCRVSPIWILYQRWSHHENAALYKAHKRLGPVVLVGPRDVSVNSIRGVKTIYQGGFEKHAWYSIFNNYGVPCMFSARSSKEHSTMKRMISNIFSKSYIQSSPSVAAQARGIIYGRLIPRIHKSIQEENGKLDVVLMLNSSSMDFVSAHCFGIGHGTDFITDEAFAVHFHHIYNHRNNDSFYRQELPTLDKLMNVLGAQLRPHVGKANAELEAWCMGMVRSVLRDIESSSPKLNSPENTPIVVSSLLTGMEKERRTKGDESVIRDTALRYPDKAIASEVFDHLLAGRETTGTTLTYVLWQLSKDQVLQSSLREELVSCLGYHMKNTTASPHPNNHQLPDPKKLDALPLLHAVLMETLRLHAALPGPQPRVTPSGPGAATATVIEGYAIPPGVRIAAMAMSLHRNEEVFPRAHVWDYTRWILPQTPTAAVGHSSSSPRGSEGATGAKSRDAARKAAAAADNLAGQHLEQHHADGKDGGPAAYADTSADARRDRIREQSRYFWAFGSGGRMCIGSNFAIQEMKLVVAAIYTNFSTHIVEETGEEDMEQGDGYATGPKAEKVYLRFEPV